MNKFKRKPTGDNGYENIDIVVIDGVKRVQCKKTGEVQPMSTAVRKSRKIAGK